MNHSKQIVNQAQEPLPSTERSTSRDLLLDFSKGIAILLVVLGHTFQAQSADFDDLRGFRVIYSFHMPLFVFLSGAAATHWIGKFSPDSSLTVLFHAAKNRIQRSVVQLLLPFLAWTLIAYGMGHSKEPLPAYLEEVFRHADRSLWFLPCIFWCTAYAAIFMFLVTALRKRLTDTSFVRTTRFLERFPNQMLLLYIVWRCVRSSLPDEFGLVFANGFHGGLFFYYLLGVVFFRRFAQTESVWVRALPYVLFFALVPYWYRTLSNSLVQDAPNWLTYGLLGKGYASIVAIAGTLAVVDLARLLGNFKIKVMDKSVAFLGTASLGIYAMHYYFIDWQPQVIAAILMSLLLYQFTSKIPVIHTILLGK